MGGDLMSRQRIAIGRDPITGKLKRIHFHGKTRQGVATRLARALHDHGRGTLVAPHKLTVGEWLEAWLQEYNHCAPGDFG
jgi:hypothetical protein